MFKTTMLIAIFVTYRVRMACTKSVAKKYRLACELDRRLARV